MNDEVTSIRWGVEQRLEFIEFRLFWEGGVRRKDIINMFGVSVPQASKDLTLYQEQVPGNVEYDKSAKRYVASHDFKPKFLQPESDGYLSRLRTLAEGLAKPSESWIGYRPDSDIALTPHREVDPSSLRAVLDAMREQRSIEVLYQSMNSVRPDPVWRRMSPHAFGYDGFRWHVRAHCHIDGKFKDFLLPRILDVRSPGLGGVTGKDDLHWQEHVAVEITPHPQLTDSQKKVVAKDYGMRDGKAVLSVRLAMLFYALKRLGLLRDPEKEEPRAQHIVLLNKDDVQAALRRAEIYNFGATEINTTKSS
ncbi:WYL domain-containing protein [Rhizobium leguminosarum]|uniref:WYL domain-containing protein n=1 Tax=Rhizobium leguminosarum TaxID=384 RepID=UPI001C951CF5|nr:WYL domain-containing protein [Rhizobium leguminosarum]MBY5364972.1 WYL domain-containing protein [Rhizobium leguminosarum]MBY5666838.1 WYL domain-containing protein [Rhizobium leguminosarum]MBY5680354.1 WYL domain-containing protein [Rhizobium leguminosarum]